MRHLLLYLPEIFLPARCKFIVASAVVGKLRTKGCNELTSHDCSDIGRLGSREGLFCMSFHTRMPKENLASVSFLKLCTGVQTNERKRDWNWLSENLFEMQTLAPLIENR